MGNESLINTLLTTSKPIDCGQAGLRVRVKTVQFRIGKASFPGRTGTLVRQNTCTFGEKPQHALWYVNLDATTRAQAREITAWICDLEAIATCENGGGTRKMSEHDSPEEP